MASDIALFATIDATPALFSRAPAFDAPCAAMKARHYAIIFSLFSCRHAFSMLIFAAHLLQGVGRGVGV
jgi:hypothetical protein